MAEEEQAWLEWISRSQSEPAAHVLLAKVILAVATRHDYTEAARLAGIKSGDTVSRMMERFNQEGLQAIQPRHGGGAAVR